MYESNYFGSQNLELGIGKLKFDWQSDVICLQNDIFVFSVREDTFLAPDHDILPSRYSWTKEAMLKEYCVVVH